MKKFILSFITICFIVSIILAIHNLNLLDSSKKNTNDTVVKEIVLGDTGFKAIATIYSAGATTDFSTRVYILKNSKNTLTDKPNIFLADHTNKIFIEWKNNELIIHSNANSKDVFIQKHSFKNIKIKYKPL